ncbi:hypothetical protein BH24CHL7_BH24CHL7_16840 [soil metagenome]
MRALLLAVGLLFLTASTALAHASLVEPGAETGTGDLLIALVTAGALLGGLVLYPFRR